MLIAASMMVGTWGTTSLFEEDNRLLLGGATAVTTFLKDAYNSLGIIVRAIRRFKEHLPFLRDLSFIQFWPGLIDTSRVLLPIIVRLPKLPLVDYEGGSLRTCWPRLQRRAASIGLLGYGYGFTGTMVGVSRLGGVLCQAWPSLAC